MKDGEGTNDIVDRMRETALNLEHHLNAGVDEYRHEIVRCLNSLHQDMDRLDAQHPIPPE